MKTKLLILLTLFFLSCKKEEIVSSEQKIKLLRVEKVNSSWDVIKLNGSEIKAPSNVKTGDVLTYTFAAQPTTPPNPNLTVSIYIDNIKEAGCISQLRFEGKIVVK